MAQFKTNPDGKPLIWFELSNGWTISLLQRWEGQECNVSCAAWPTVDRKDKADMIIGPSEATDDEALAFIIETAKREPV